MATDLEDRLAKDAYLVALVSVAEDLPRLMKQENAFLVALIIGLTKAVKEARPDVPFIATKGGPNGG